MVHDNFTIPIPLDGYAPLEITFDRPENFLKIKETLTRIGIESKNKKILWQSCHILHRRQHYYIMSFKELFALDGKLLSILQEDIDRRNTIAKLLEEWKLLKIVNKQDITTFAPMAQIKVIPFSQKTEWSLMSKYTVGGKPALTNSDL